MSNSKGRSEFKASCRTPALHLEWFDALLSRVDTGKTEVKTALITDRLRKILEWRFWRPLTVFLDSGCWYFQHLQPEQTRQVDKISGFRKKETRLSIELKETVCISNERKIIGNSLDNGLLKSFFKQKAIYSPVSSFSIVRNCCFSVDRLIIE